MNSGYPFFTIEIIATGMMRPFLPLLWLYLRTGSTHYCDSVCELDLPTTVTLLAFYLLLHYSTCYLYACYLPDVYLVQAAHIGSGIGSGGSVSPARPPAW